MSRSRHGVVLLLLALAAWPALARAASGEKFAGEGVAPLSSDPARGRDRALGLALEAAVLAGAHAAVGDAAWKAKETAIRGRLIFHTAGFVLGYRITAEGASGTGPGATYKVAVEATVAVDRLRDALKGIVGSGAVAPGTGAPAAPAAHLAVSAPGLGTAEAAAGAQPVVEALERLGFGVSTAGTPASPVSLALALSFAAEELSPLRASDFRCAAVRADATLSASAAAVGSARGIACASSLGEARVLAAARAGTRVAADVEKLPAPGAKPSAPAAPEGVAVLDAPGPAALLEVADAVGKLAPPLRGLVADGATALVAAADPTSPAAAGALAAAAAALPRRLPAFGLVPDTADPAHPAVRFTVVTIAVRSPAATLAGHLPAARAAIAALPGTLRVDDAGEPAAAAAAGAAERRFRVWNPAGTEGVAAALAAWAPSSPAPGTAVRVEEGVVVVDIP